MATTSGDAALVPIEPPVSRASPPSPARRRLRSVVDVVGAYVAGRPATPTVPPVQRAASCHDERRLSQLERIAGPLGPGSYPAPVRPRPIDKPSALAHYQAMASQVAYERQVAELDERLEATRPGGHGRRDVWFAHPARRTGGDRRHG